MLSSLNQEALSKAKRLGAEQSEAFSTRTRTVAVYVEDSKVKSVEEKLDQGITLRVMIGKRRGQVSSSVSSEEEVARVAERAIKATRLSNPDPDLKGFVQPKEAAIAAPRVWDARMAELEGSDLVAFAKGIVEAAREVGEVKIPRGLIRAATIETAVSNSNGVEVGHSSTMYYLHYTSMVTSPRPGEGIEAAYGTQLDIDVEGIGRKLYEGARNSALAKPFKGKRNFVAIIPPGELAEMLLTTVGAASGENVNFRRSRWVESLGKEVASKEVTIRDDPTDPRGVLCSRFDDEGTPSRRKTIVEHGVLKELYYDSYSAGIAGAESTGNGLKRSSIDAQGIYQHSVGCSVMNLVLAPGTLSPGELISDVDEGVIIERFAWPDVDQLTGRFGLEVRCGHLVKGGEITETINHALLMGNMYDALKNVRGIGNDSKVVGRAIVPTVSFDGIELVG